MWSSSAATVLHSKSSWLCVATSGRRAAARPLVVARNSGSRHTRQHAGRQRAKANVDGEVLVPDIVSDEELPRPESTRAAPAKEKKKTVVTPRKVATPRVGENLDEIFGGRDNVQLRSLESRTQGGTAGRLVSIDEKSIDEIDDPVEKRVATKHRSHLMMLKSMPRVLLIHTGGTLGMDPQASYTMEEETPTKLREATGGAYTASLKPSQVLADLMSYVPELQSFANLNVEVAFNMDSSRVGPKEWTILAKMLHSNRSKYDAFLVIHGTDTMAYTASALSLMLSGFGKPIIMTGSQLPLLMPRSDARQNLIDSITCATAGSSHPYIHLSELAVCFGGHLIRGNRAQKINSTTYQAFGSPSYPLLAELGVEVEFKKSALLVQPICYQPRFKLNTNVIRMPIVSHRVSLTASLS